MSYLRQYEPYIPQHIGELSDLIGSFMLASPKFEDTSGYFPDKNIDTAFYALTEGLKNLRKKLGEDRYYKLIDMTARMRAHFEADPEDETGETMRGRELIYEMQDVLKSRRKDRSV